MGLYAFVDCAWSFREDCFLVGNILHCSTVTRQSARHHGCSGKGQSKQEIAKM